MLPPGPRLAGVGRGRPCPGPGPPAGGAARARCGASGGGGGSRPATPRGTASRKRSSRLWRRCSSRTSGSPSSGDRVADDVVLPVLGHREQDGPSVGHGLEAVRDEGRREGVLALLDLHGEDAGPLGEGAERGGPQQPPGIDRHEEVADALDLAEQVAGDDDRDPELRAGPLDEREHLVATGRIEAVGRLVEQQQSRPVDERLGELDPLLHPGRIPADRPVALLVEPDVAQDLGGAFARRGAREAGHARHLGDEVGRRGVRREAVVFGHVADELADRRALRANVEVHHRRLARRRFEQAEQDLEQRALARPVGTDQADDPGLEVEGQAVERGDAARISLGQVPEGDEAHALSG